MELLYSLVADFVLGKVQLLGVLREVFDDRFEALVRESRVLELDVGHLLEVLALEAFGEHLGVRGGGIPLRICIRWKNGWPGFCLCRRFLLSC